MMKDIQASGLKALVDTRALVTSAHVLDGTGQYARSAGERELITNACFLRVFITLEEFFEASFAHYAVGRMSTTRWRASTYARPRSELHAHEMFAGFGRFVDWSTPEKVIKLANLYFTGGGPFVTPIRSTYSQLNSMKTVRNATAHVSHTTQASLDALYSRWTGTPTIGSTAYRMLMATSAGGSDTFYGVSEKTVTAIINQVSTHS